MTVASPVLINDQSVSLVRTTEFSCFKETARIEDAETVDRVGKLLGANSFHSFDIGRERQLAIARPYDQPGNLALHLMSGNHTALKGDVNLLRSDFFTKESIALGQGGALTEYEAAISAAEEAVRLGQKPVQNIIVTGASGTIGSELLLALINCGYNVVGIDERTCRFNPVVDPFLVIGDLREASTYEAVRKRMPQVDLVMHLAADPEVHVSVKDPKLGMRCLNTQFAVTEFARSMNAAVGFASSREVYGKQPRTLVPESAAPFQHAESPYSWAKLSGETMMQTWAGCYKMPYTVFRFSNVYGPNENRSSRVMCVWTRAALKGEDLTVFGEEEGLPKSYSFTHISDATAAAVSIARGMRAPHMRDQTYNICGPEAVSLHDAALLIQDIVARIRPNVTRGAVHLLPNRTGEINWFQGDPKKLELHTGHRPTVRFADGMPAAIQGYVNFIEAGHDNLWRTA